MVEKEDNRNLLQRSAEFRKLSRTTAQVALLNAERSQRRQLETLLNTCRYMHVYIMRGICLWLGNARIQTGAWNTILERGGEIDRCELDIMVEER